MFLITEPNKSFVSSLSNFLLLIWIKSVDTSSFYENAQIYINANEYMLIQFFAIKHVVTNLCQQEGHFLIQAIY